MRADGSFKNTRLITIFLASNNEQVQEINVVLLCRSKNARLEEKLMSWV